MIKGNYLFETLAAYPLRWIQLFTTVPKKIDSTQLDQLKRIGVGIHAMPPHPRHKVCTYCCAKKCFLFQIILLSTYLLGVNKEK